jgi:hypothetical protein
LRLALRAIHRSRTACIPCEHAFVRRVEYEGHFNAAIQKGDLDGALRDARGISEFGPLRIQQALKLLLLIARLRNHRFEEAAKHWEEMHRAENRPAVEQRIATAAIEGLSREETRPRCERVLWDLVGSTETKQS